MKKTPFKITAVLAAGLMWAGASAGDSGAGPGKTLTMDDFIKTTVAKDSSFEEILTGRLALKYSKDLALPAKDLILSIKSQNEFYLNQDRSDPRIAVSLSKLFPYSGSEVSAEYSATPYSGAEGVSSLIALYFSQPIAQNAFGKATLLQDRITGAETEIAGYQITEAYEDYLASAMVVYYNWYSAFENLKIGNSSYEQSLKLLENIQKRQKSNIALPIDVNKIRIQVLGKKENLITLEKEYDATLNLIKQAIRYEGEALLEPASPFKINKAAIAFEKEYRKFADSSRTYEILKLLEKTSSLNVDKYADNLLPSTNLLFGLKINGDDFGVKGSDSDLYAGVSLKWLFSDQAGRARHELARISDKTTRLSNASKYARLKTDLKNLFLRIERERELIETSDEKIDLSRLILADETVNYSYGKVSLNDLITAVNRIDDNNFNKLNHLVRYKVLMTEWLRITDQLVSAKELKKKK
ncbi:MAG: TolC family protein [Elusimicrobia bacterium]|nr:TolC family protein [Elusimicrobiota bacterium]